jgi:Skp family chaperone for outer membrane proteins
MRAWAAVPVLAFALALGPAGPAGAQDPAGGQRAPILTIDQDRLFEQSAYGRAAIARAEAETAALGAENQRIEAALEAEERDLTERRAVLPSADFAPLAEAFDEKVEGIRAAQDAKIRAIPRQLEADRRAFFAAALPLLGGILEEFGAVAILDRSAIVLSLSAIDVTDSAIARVDERLPATPAPPSP